MKVVVFVKATKESEAGAPANAELMAQMMKCNEELVKAGIMLDGAGLKPSSQSKRVHFKARSAR